MVVQVNLSVIPLSIASLEASPEDVAIIDTNVLSGVME
jgi:hypothetical protein